MLDQARFFPGDAVYALTMWNRLQTRAAYRTYLAAGLWFWLVPSVLAGITVRWQKDLVWG